MKKTLSYSIFRNSLLIIILLFKTLVYADLPKSETLNFRYFSNDFNAVIYTAKDALKQQTIQFDPITYPPRYASSVNIIATGGDSGNPVVFTSSDLSIAKIEYFNNNYFVTSVGFGTVTITASQAGNSEYDAATPVSQTITITEKGLQTVRFNPNPTPKRINDPWSFYVPRYNTQSPNLRPYFTSSDPSIVTISGASNYQLKGVGTAMITVHLDGDDFFEAANPVTMPQEVLMADQTINFLRLADKLYGDASFDLTATGGSSGNPITYTSSNSVVATVNGKKITVLKAGTTTITASQSGDNFYNAATDVSQSFTVNPATLTYKADLVSVPFNFPIPTLTGSVEGLVNSEQLENVTQGSVQFTTTATNGSPIGVYAIVGSGLTTNSNYTLEQATTNGTALTITNNLPAVTTTNPATSITSSSATVQGNVTADGGYNITEKGIVYGTSINPTIETDTKLTDGDGLGAISKNLSNLNPGTVYNFRTYATNSQGTSYGSNGSFATKFATPETQATSIVTSGTATNSKTISWTNGNGAKRLVFVSSISDGYPLVVDGTTYTANSSFTSFFSSSVSGSTSGSSWKCVYNSTGNSVTVTSLTTNRNYRVMVLEYNGAGATTVYNSSIDDNNPVIFSTPISTPTGVAISGRTNTSFSADFAAISGASNYLFDISTVNDFSQILTRYNSKSASINRIEAIDLLPSTTYYVRLRSVNTFNLASANSTSLTFTTLADSKFEATFDFVSATSGSSIKTDPTPVPLISGLEFGAYLYNGTSTSSATSSQFGYNGWDNSTSVNTSKYFEVTITPSVEHRLSLNNMIFSATRNTSGAKKYAVRSSLDSYVKNLNVSSTGTAVASADYFSLAGTTKLTGSTIATGSEFSNLTSPVTFRIYPYEATNATGTFSIDDVKFSGTVYGPPLNATTFPSVSDIAATSVIFNSNLDKKGTTYYVLIPADGVAPISTSQIFEGKDGNGDLAKAGSLTITNANTTYNTVISDLTANTTYKVYVVSEDASSTPLKQSDFITLDFSTSAKTSATLSLSDLSSTYDGTPKPATAITSPSGLTGVSITYDGNSTAPTDPGNYAVIASLTNDNYSAINATGTLVIAKANQTITFSALANKTFGDASFNLTAAGGSSGNSITYLSSNTSVATISGNSVTIIGAGTTNITASQAGNTNYNAASDVIQQLTVGKANQTITFPNFPAKTSASADFEPGATINTSLTLTYTSSNTAVATVYQDANDSNKWKIKINNDGTTDITAEQAGNANYNSVYFTKQLDVGTVLPVSLIDYQAKIQNNKEVLLSWTTVSEADNAGFEILKSIDGKTFTNLAFVKGAGNSNAKNVYSHIDLSLSKGTNYYQLVQVDHNGTKSNKGVKSVNFSFGDNNQISFYPNPTADIVNVAFEAGVYKSLNILDLSGKVLIKNNILATEAKATVSLSAYPDAVYILQLTGKNGTISKQILKK